jgi:hypothetical protein
MLFLHDVKHVKTLDLIHIDNNPMFETYQLLEILVNNTCYFFELIFSNQTTSWLVHSWSIFGA